MVQRDFDISTLSSKNHKYSSLLWSFDKKGRLVSQSTGLVIDIDMSNVQAGTVLQTWTVTGDNQQWILSDTPNVNGFLLRCEEHPELVLECYKRDADTVIVMVHRYTGSIWQHWTLTPEGYIASCAKDNGLMMVFDYDPGKSH